MRKDVVTKIIFILQKSISDLCLEIKVNAQLNTQVLFDRVGTHISVIMDKYKQLFEMLINELKEPDHSKRKLVKKRHISKKLADFDSNQLVIEMTRLKKADEKVTSKITELDKLEQETHKMSRELKDKDVEVSVLRKQYFEMKEENMNKLERISIMYSSVKENAERDSLIIEKLKARVNYLE